MVGENFNNKCDSCGTELTNIYSYSGGYLFSKNHNFFQAFLTTKGKKQEDNDKFQFCDKCEKEFKNYLIEEAIQELKTKNIANSELLTHRWSSGDFTKEDWQKYQNAVVENIKRYGREWKIKEVNYQPYEREKPRPPNYQMPLVPGQVRKETILFHQSAKLEYDQNDSLDLEKWWDPRKVYFDRDFLPEKLTEIEKFLKVAREEERNKNQSNSDHKQPPTAPILPILGIAFNNFISSFASLIN